MQEFIYCGPREEECVENQSLKDKNCSVPCTGLYADITDDSLKQSTQAFERYVTKGKPNFYRTQVYLGSDLWVCLSQTE